MTPHVDGDLCIGCGLCEDTCPEVFEMGDDGLSHVIEEEPEQELFDRVRECVEVCPTDAISIEED